MIPSKEQNPNGLHKKYIISKVSGEPVDDNAEYFVLRLDSNGDDEKHISACRKAIIAYANAIRSHLPELAKDLIYKYNHPENRTTNKYTEAWRLLESKYPTPSETSELRWKDVIALMVDYAQSVTASPKCESNTTEAAKAHIKSKFITGIKQMPSESWFNNMAEDLVEWGDIVTAGVRKEIIQSEKERILIAQELSHHIVLFAAEYAYRKANPETKMDVPSIVYEDTEKAWRKYLDTIKPSSITAGVRKEKGLTDEDVPVIKKILYDTCSKEDTPEGITTTWDFEEQAKAIVNHYRAALSQSVPKEQGEGWVEIKRSWDGDNLPEGEVLAMNMDENRVYWIMMGKISEYTLFKSKQVELKCTDNDGNWRSGPTHYRTIESLSLPTPPKPE